MNNENLHNIFNNTDCISTEKMIDYQDGKLSEMDKNSVEKHLSSCNMCHDEFEGLLLISNKAAISHTVFELNNKVDTILANTHKKIPFLMPINLMAAIILFIIGFAWYTTYYIRSVSNMKKEQVSQSVYIGSKDRGEIIIIRPQPSLSESENNLKSTSENEDKIVSSDFELEETKTEDITDYSLSDNKKVANNEIIESEIKSDSNKSDISISGNEVAESANISDDKNYAAKEELNKSKKKEDLNLATENKDVAIATDETAKNEKKNNGLNRAKNSSVTSNTARSDNFNLAMSAYSKHDYRNAIELFKQSMNEYQAKDEIHFYLALSYENIQLPQEALSNYNKVISYEQSDLYEQALWNKSQLLLKLDKRKSAINSLNQVKNLKRNYYKQAENQLDSLYKK